MFFNSQALSAGLDRESSAEWRKHWRTVSYLPQVSHVTILVEKENFDRRHIKLSIRQEHWHSKMKDKLRTHQSRLEGQYPTGRVILMQSVATVERFSCEPRRSFRSTVTGERSCQTGNVRNKTVTLTGLESLGTRRCPCPSFFAPFSIAVV